MEWYTCVEGANIVMVVVVAVRSSMVYLDPTKEIIRGRQERLTIGDNILVGNRQGDVQDHNRVLGRT